MTATDLGQRGDGRPATSESAYVGSPSDAATGSPRDYLELVRLLDLYPADTLEEQIRELQEHRASVLAALRAPDPPVPTSTSMRLRACQHEAVELCEQALDTLNAPYDADGEGDEA